MSSQRLQVEADLKQLVKLDSTSSFVGGIRVQAGQSAPTTVFFARCPPVTTEEQVRQVFSDFGQIDEINLYRRWQSAKTSKGCGFVRYKEHAAAAAALEALNGKFMFETSEAPMVVEWIDPARLVTRQPTSGKSVVAAKYFLQLSRPCLLIMFWSNGWLMSLYACLTLQDLQDITAQLQACMS